MRDFDKLGFDKGEIEMKIVKNIMLVILTVLAGIVLFVGIFMLINGSLEAFPTQEQIEKIRICGWLFTVVGVALEVIFAIALYKNNKRNKF